ncbi:uncharacterized protein LOC121098760 isoform X1 [Falco naumanni]|uniref:uncharacterized protein LOC121098760 isoform X1 n=1 Tax=Falco naumanni TaxID=148594 RepID=UPI001ADDF53B|nr:uncharacterized protein LOC121098760 isoform X1 [Falco naumanni]
MPRQGAVWSENKILQQKHCGQADKGRRNEENEGHHFRDRRTEVTFEIKAFKVTAACASGYTEGSHLEMPQYSVKLLLPDADHSLAEIKVELLLLEDELPKDQMQAQERSAGSGPCIGLKSICWKRMSGTSSDGTDDDDQGKPHFSDSLPPGGIGSSRKKPKKERQQLAAQKNTETTEVEKEVLILKISCWNQAELAEEGTTPSLMPTLLEIMTFTIFVFVIFMCVTNGG